uniref:Solute carrier family 15 member 5 n=1 Tax=Ictidomys tridecemlineatus TaxID=43179 RepID=I3MBN9_ICTTR
MSVTHFTITDEEVALHLSTEREKTVGICLLLVELCERFTFFEVVCNMIPFCTVKLGYHNYQAAILNLCFIGTSILTPVLVGWLADIFLGRNKLVYICLFLHFLGTALLSGVAFPSEDSYIGSYHVINHIPTKEQNRLFHVALLAISLGTGGIRAIVCPQAAYGCSLLATFGVFVNALKTCCLQYFHLGRDVTDWLDHAKEKNGGHYSELLVEDTKPFFALLPLFIFQLIYRVCIMQIPSAYYLQTMNSNLNLDGFLLPIAVMNAISSLPLLVLAPFMEYFSTCLFPSKRDGPFLSACIIAGNLSAALSVMVAGFSEIRRKHFPLLEQPLLGQVLPVSSMPCFHLVLQYVLLGVAETLVNPALSIIAHRFVPRTVRGTSMNFLTLFNGFGCFTGALLVELVYLISEGNWFPNTLNKGNLESFFFLLASLTLLNVLGFWSVSQRYCNLNHFNAQNISGSNLEETLLLHEKSLKFYGSTQEISSSIDLWETAL